MAAKRNRDWQVGPNLKPKPGSQGTLFRGNGPMRDEHWPKKYTPERLAEVRPIVMGNHSNIRDRATTAPQRRTLIDTVARSTVPYRHLQGAQFFPGQSTLGEGTVGLYSPPEDSLSRGSISIKRGWEDHYAPIHEIGHHVDRHSFPAYGLRRHGATEGFADEYAETHYRDKKGRPIKIEGYGSLEHLRSRPLDFQTGYWKERGSDYWEHNRANAAKSHDQIKREVIAEENPEDVAALYHQPPLIGKATSQNTRDGSTQAALVDPEWRRKAGLPSLFGDNT